MKVTSERIHDCQALLNVELEPDEVEEGMQEAYKHLVGKVKVPGFRPGKAPRAILEHHIGTEAMMEEALEHLIPEAYEEALKKESLEAVARPRIELVKIEPVTFKATVPLRPVVRLGNYKAEMRLQPDPVEVTEDEIDTAIEAVQDQTATLTPVERASQFGDVLTVNIVGIEKGETFLDHKDSLCELKKNSPAPLPGFAEALAGASKGETREFTLSFPSDHENGQIAGKDYSFKVTVNEVKEKKLPEINDEFAKENGAESLGQWREKLVDQLKKRKEANVRRDFEKKLVDAVVKFAEVEYPPALVEEEIDDLIRDQASNFKEGVRGLEDYLKSIGKTVEEYREELRGVAGERVVRALVLRRVAEEEKIEVAEEEADAETERMVKENPDNAEQLRRFWTLPQARTSVKNYLMNRKIIARLEEIARGEGLPAQEENK
ncbi:MAG: trigger factor [Chloroflexota bacterium]